MARGKIKSKKDCNGCDNNIQRDLNLVETSGVGTKGYLINEDNFDSEDHEYTDREHGLSIKSYRASKHISNKLSQRSRLLNKGKRNKSKESKLRRIFNLEVMSTREDW